MKLLELLEIIKDRKKKMPSNSYTTSLFNEGLDKIIQKVEEEFAEALFTAKNESKERLVEETSDLLYHILVLLAEKSITLEEIESELEKRHKKR